MGGGNHFLIGYFSRGIHATLARLDLGDRNIETDNTIRLAELDHKRQAYVPQTYNRYCIQFTQPPKTSRIIPQSLAS